jgi:putative oxidoreductase
MSKLFGSNGVWDNGIAIVRVLTGWLIFRYSWELFHITGLIDFLTQVKFPFPVFSGYAAKIIEFVGGIFLMLGLLTRWITPLLMITMAGVIYIMHQGNIYEGELPFLFLLLFAGFFFRGAGKWSLDHWLELRSQRRKSGLQISAEK